MMNTLTFFEIQKEPKLTFLNRFMFDLIDQILVIDFAIFVLKEGEVKVMNRVLFIIRPFYSFIVL